MGSTGRNTQATASEMYNQVFQAVGRGEISLEDGIRQGENILRGAINRVANTGVEEYKGVEIRQRPSGNFELFAPTNGTRRIFNTIEQARDYIDNAEVRDSNFMAMGTDTGSFTQSPNRGSGRRRTR